MASAGKKHVLLTGSPGEKMLLLKEYMILIMSLLDIFKLPSRFGKISSKLQTLKCMYVQAVQWYSM